jgi:hypothetical protein
MGNTDLRLRGVRRVAIRDVPDQENRETSHRMPRQISRITMFMTV